jgi:hypothetical protein
MRRLLEWSQRRYVKADAKENRDGKHCIEAAFLGFFIAQMANPATSGAFLGPFDGFVLGFEGGEHMVGMILDDVVFDGITLCI